MSKEKDQYVVQTPNQFAPERAKPEDFVVQHQTSFFNGEGADDISGRYDTVKKRRTGRGLDTNRRVLKHENTGSGVFSRDAGKKTQR
jgi:hypothetical protein